MKASDYFYPAHLTQNGQKIAEGTLLGMISQLDAATTNDRLMMRVHSATLGELSNDTATKLLHMHSTSSFDE